MKLIDRLKALAQEAEDTRKECGYNRCVSCKWNLRCSKALRQAVKRLERASA